MNLKKKIGKVFTSKLVGTGPLFYKKRIYRAVVSQRLRNTELGLVGSTILKYKVKTRQDVRVRTDFICFVVGSGIDFVNTAMSFKIL
jgi:hypothetical protein